MASNVAVLLLSLPGNSPPRAVSHYCRNAFSFFLIVSPRLPMLVGFMWSGLVYIFTKWGEARMAQEVWLQERGQCLKAAYTMGEAGTPIPSARLDQPQPCSSGPRTARAVGSASPHVFHLLLSGHPALTPPELRGGVWITTMGENFSRCGTPFWGPPESLRGTGDEASA